MPELTPEAFAELTKRVEALEKQAADRASAKQSRKKDWRRVVGMFTDSEFMKEVDAEGAALRDAERQAATGESVE